MNLHDLGVFASTLFESSNDAVILFDPVEDRILEVNPAAVQLCGWSRCEMIGMSLHTVVGAHGLLERERLRRACCGEQSLQQTQGYVLHHRDGQRETPVNLTVTRCEQAHGVLGLVQAHDQSEPRRTQVLLRQKEAELEAVLEGVSDWVWSADLEPGGQLRMRYCSPAVERLTGQPVEVFLRDWTRWLEVTRAEDRAKLEQALDRLRRGASVREQVEHGLQAGRRRWVRTSIQARSEGGRLRLDGVVSDITEVISRQEQLRASEARCRALLENLEQSIFLKDRDLRFVAANRRFCEGIHQVESGIIGKTDFDLYPEELAAKYRADDLRVLSEEIRLEVEEQTLVERQLRWVRVIKTPVRDLEDRVVGVLGIFWDVTEYRALEEQLRQAARMEAVGQLAGGVAHDFNNLLTAILGNLSLLRTRIPNEWRSSVGSLIDAAEQASWRAATLTRQLLGFSRRTVLHIQACDVNHTLEEVQALLQPTIDPRIRLKRTPGTNLWPVLADPGQLCQVLLNLALNARDAVQQVLDEGGTNRPEGVEIGMSTENVSLEVSDLVQHPLGRPGKFVRVNVSDNGIGIDPDILPRIFEPFFTTKGPDRGTGLGLAMVFGIVQQHQGWVECRSERGQGTRFEIYLPRSEEKPPDSSPVAPPVTVQSRGTILLVDDEPMLLNLGSLILRREGFEVLQASDGQEAVEQYQQSNREIVLVVLDRTMPRLSGRDALKQMKQINPNVPVLLASGYAADLLSDEERQHLLGFLNKPYSPDDLIQAVRAALARAEESLASPKEERSGS